MALIFVYCEACGASPSTGTLTEFGAVEFKSRKTFHGKIWDKSWPDTPTKIINAPEEVFKDFASWLQQFKGRPTFVSDNPAYDWQWINDGFHLHLDENPFGFSARRIGDFYAGLMGNFYAKQDWKRLRKTTHDHHPVHDAMGNVEAFQALLEGKFTTPQR